MSATIDQLRQRLNATREKAHARCIACGSTDGHAPRLKFIPNSEGGVEAVFHPTSFHQGYEGILHGGVIATLLDAAMTNCLFARGHCGVTADLHIRYRHPVASGKPCTLYAWIERETRPLFVLRAELRQGGKLHVVATAKFMEQSVHAP